MASLETRALQACWDSSTAGQINVCPFGRVLLSIACVVHHSCYEMGAFNEFWESVDPSVWSYANLQAHLITNGLVWPFWERKEIIRKKCEDSPPPGTTSFSFQWALWLAIPQWSLKPDHVQHNCQHMKKRTKYNNIRTITRFLTVSVWQKPRYMQFPHEWQLLK